MASLLMRAAVSVALVAVVQGGTYIDMLSASDSNCSTVKKVHTLKQGVCESDNPVVGGVEVAGYSMRSCDSTHAIDTYYSDSACTTALTGATPWSRPLGCTASSAAGVWDMNVCDQTYSEGPTLQIYGDSSCSGYSLTNMTIIRGRACFPDGVASNGAWTDVSETRVMSGGAFVLTRYSTSDCSGTGTASTHTCGTCAVQQVTVQEGVQTYNGSYSGCSTATVPPTPSPPTPAPPTPSTGTNEPEGTSSAVANAKTTVAATMAAAVFFVAKGI